jgi:HEAT repeat protein
VGRRARWCTEKPRSELLVSVFDGQTIRRLICSTGPRSAVLSLVITMMTASTLVFAVCGCASSRDLVESLIGNLQSESDSARAEAVRALGAIDDPRAVEPLIAILKDRDDYARLFVVKALGAIDDPRVVEPLITVLEDDRDDLRDSAAQALAAIDDPRVVEPLIAYCRDGHARFQTEVVQALAASYDPRTVDTLVGALCEGSSLIEDEVTAALVEIGAPAVEPLLAAELQLANDDGEFVAMSYVYGYDRDASNARRIRMAVVKTLIRIGQSDSVQSMIDNLNAYRYATDLAGLYLNSGNTALAQGAEEWAHAHDYVVYEYEATGESSSAVVRWGQK